MLLREWMKTNRYTVKAFSELIGVNRPYIHGWMSGKRKPSKEMLKAVRQATNWKVRTFDDLLDIGRELTPPQ